jgi:hypothetical protein
MLVMPDKHWRIITSAKHSTVWDGGDLIFDFNFQAFGIDPNECFNSAYHKELLPGKYRRVYLPVHDTTDRNRRKADVVIQAAGNERVVDAGLLALGGAGCTRWQSGS